MLLLFILKNVQERQLLYAKFKPIIKSSIDKVNLTKHWQTLILRYNAIPLHKKLILI